MNERQVSSDDATVNEREKQMDVDYAALDPGIRDIVRKLNNAGFTTSDSGDGVSKPADWYASGEAMPFPHVVAATTPTGIVADAERLAALLGDGWNVEACYQTLTRTAHLLARTTDARERAAASDDGAARPQPAQRLITAAYDYIRAVEG